MTHNVSSWFINEAAKNTLEPVRRFTIGSSDYSDHVMKWPKFKQVHNNIRPVSLTVNLSNGDKQFNFIKSDTTLLTSDSKFEMGFKGTNLLRQSEDFSTTWALTGTPIIVTNVFVSPDGNTTADTIEDNNGISAEYITQGSSTFLLSNFYCGSVYVRKDSTPRATRFARIDMVFTGSVNEGSTLSLDTSTGEFSVTEGSTTGSYGVTSEGDYWRIHISVKSVAANTAVGLYIHPSAGASNTWVPSDSATGICTFWGAQINEGLNLTSYRSTLTTTHDTDETITLFTGKMERVKYKDGKCTITFVDKFKQLTERLMGSSDDAVTYTGSNYLPADIAWYSITSYGGYDTTASSANTDIDYESWLTWSDVFSASAVFVNANFNGKKVSEVLRKIADYTDSAIFVSDNKINFKRFSLTDSNQTAFNDDSIRKLELLIDDRKVTNRMHVAGDYDVTSKYWKITVNDENTASVNSYGLKEDTVKDSNLWYVNSGSASNLAQRKVNAAGTPFNSLKVETNLKGLPRIIGETISVIDLSVDVSEGYRIMGQTVDMDTGKLLFLADRSYFSAGFILDTSTLGSAVILT